MKTELDRNKSYWRANLKIVSCLMVVWFFCSFGFGIIFSDILDQFRVGGFKLGFWFAQQGSIYIFIVLVFAYIHLMNKLDRKYAKIEKKD
tara:strand:+ start:41 stop:310 length:270 start_codon:yes stop_codon:yes gene_type:complete